MSVTLPTHFEMPVTQRIGLSASHQVMYGVIKYTYMANYAQKMKKIVAWQKYPLIDIPFGFSKAMFVVPSVPCLVYPDITYDPWYPCLKIVCKETSIYFHFRKIKTEKL